MLQLRPYQIESVNAVRGNFAQGHKRVVLCLPTGAGKTVVFSEIARMTVERGHKVLVLTDRTELFEQTIRSVGKHSIPIQHIAPHIKRVSDIAPCYVGMVETLKRRAGKSVFIKPDLIIIDEAHKGNFNAIFELYPDAYYIGATATPIGKHFHKLYTSIVESVTIKDLIAEGYLAPCYPFQMQDDLSDLNTVAGEFTDESQFNHYNKSKLYEGVIETWREKANGLKTIVFNVNIEHSEKMTEQFNAAGIISHSITSKTDPNERKFILSAFKRGEFPVLNNCGILTTGYDEPSIECVIMNRATMSLPLWLQCCGRGSRIYPGKRGFVLLDFGLNHDRHGLWMSDRTWSLEPPKKRKKADAAPIKICKICSAVIAASARSCEFCNAEMPVKEKQLSTGVLVAVDNIEFKGKRVSELSIEQLARLNAFKSTYIWRVIRSRGTDAIKEFARIKGYKKGWVYNQNQKIKDSNHRDYIIP